MDLTRSPLVEMEGISKEFPGVRALTDVNLRIGHGEVHVLFGENGAGKSTLISILSGVFRPTKGRIRIDGAEVDFQTVRDAAAAGVSTVFQELSLVPTLSVYENLYLGREISRGPFMATGAMISGARQLFAALDFDINVKSLASRLSRAQQQMVEIAKACASHARILILDEPTASLTEHETNSLFTFIRKVTDAGVGVIYISHRIQEFERIADRISVLRDGRLIATVPARGTSERKLIELMTGRPADTIYPTIEPQRDAPLAMTLRGVRTSGARDVDLDVWAGQVLGVAGLAGSGKSRLWRAVMGLQAIDAGTVTFRGRDVTSRPTRKLLRDGIFYLPPDRKREGLDLAASARSNLELSVMSLPGIAGRLGLVNARHSAVLTSNVAQRVNLTSTNIARTTAKLSGGNQQKVLFGKCFGTEFDVYIFDEPTVGVDVTTRVCLYQLIKELAEAGKAVVVISSDLPEVMGLAHRLAIFAQGQVVAELDSHDFTEEGITRLFFSNPEIIA